TRSSASSGSWAAPASPCGGSGATGATTGCNPPGGRGTKARDRSDRGMKLRRLLRPLPHLERDPGQHLLLIGVGAALAPGAVVGISWAAGFHQVLHDLHHVDPIWLPVAFGMEVAAYLGYVVAYREVA